MGLIELIFSNKLLLAAVTFLIGGVLVYFKGYSSGQNASEQAQEHVKEVINRQIKQAEARNQQVDLERQSNAQKVDNAGSDINKLIGLWDSLNKQDGSNNSEPKP